MATLHRVYKALDVPACEMAVGAWLRQTGVAPDDPIAVDGKSLRGVHGHVEDEDEDEGEDEDEEYVPALHPRPAPPPPSPSSSLMDRNDENPCQKRVPSAARSARLVV